MKTIVFRFLLSLGHNERTTCFELLKIKNKNNDTIVFCYKTIDFEKIKMVMNLSFLAINLNFFQKDKFINVVSNDFLPREKT